jgi:hypothetical protein
MGKREEGRGKGDGGWVAFDLGDVPQFLDI